MTDRATSFGQQAGSYERARPEYPAEAVAWMLGDAGPEVIDVGAGTGKLTRGVLATGRTAVAVDPDALMLAELAARTPGVRTLVGSAETLPVPDSSADAVVFGQSWHWVDPEAGSREAGRVLRSDGVLGLIWNFVDLNEPWVAQFIDIMSASVAETLIAGGSPRIVAPFEAVETRTFPWTRELAAEQLPELASSRSEVITASAPDREAILAEVRALASRTADGHGMLRMPYVTHVFRAVKPSQPS
jgi:ubiquinone/menaquinone biosynthesis C-methylase UbiE